MRNNDNNRSCGKILALLKFIIRNGTAVPYGIFFFNLQNT